MDPESRTSSRRSRNWPCSSWDIGVSSWGLEVECTLEEARDDADCRALTCN